MNIIKAFTILAAPVALFAACNKIETTVPQDSAEVIVKAGVSAMSTKSNPLGDAEAQTRFSAGDRIEITSLSSNYQSAIYKLEDDGSWTPEGNSRLVWQNGKNLFEARFPAGYSFCTDQSDDAGLSAADYMEEKSNSTVTSAFEAEDDGSHVLSLQMERCNALVTFKIAKFNDQFNADEAEISDFKVFLKDDDGNAVEVSPYIRDAQGIHQPKGTSGKLGYTYSAISTVAGASPADDFVKLDIKAGGEVRSLSVTGIPAFEKGKAYTYNLTVGKDRILVDAVTVADWGSVDLGQGDEFEAVFNGDIWDGSVATGFTTGTGTQSDPYIIATGAELAFLAEQVNSGVVTPENYNSAYYRLGANIDLNGRPWTPIGYYDNGSTGKPFQGSFNGCGYSIFNLKVDASGTPDRSAGFFGAATGTIQNLNIVDADIEGTLDAGILVGYMAQAGGSTSKPEIKQCTVSGSVSGTERCGGLVGWISYVEVSYCDANVTVNGSAGQTGGLVGNAFASKLQSCTASGKVAGAWVVGGIAGYLWSDSQAISCHSYVDVTASYLRCGGFAGCTEENVTITDCIVYGSAKTTLSSNCRLGGFIGEIYSATTVTGCGFSGEIEAPEKADGVYVGAFIGYDNGGGKTVECWYDSDSTLDGYEAVGYIESTSSHDIEKK